MQKKRILDAREPVYKYRPDFLHFYEDIPIMKPKKWNKTIYEVEKKPVEIDSLSKIFLSNDGIRPFLYKP